MRLAFITLTSGVPFGSCDLLNFRIAKLAHEQGHEVLLSVNDFKKKHHKNYIEIEKSGVKVHKRLMYDAKNIITRSIFKIQYKLFKQTRYFKECFDFKPDYIFINNQGTYDFVSNPISELLLNTKIPFAILSQHNPEINSLPAIHYKKARSIFLKSNKIFFISHRNLETAKRNLALPLSNGIVVCNPLSSNTQNYIPYPDCEIPTMCMVARFNCDAKGQDLMLSVLGNDYWKKKDWRLNIYGEGPDEKWLKDLTEYYGLTDKVFFKGYEDNIEEIWKHNQLLIMPSISEGTPITLLTAIVAGRAALVTNVGGNAEFVINHKSGFIAEAPTFNCLNEALKDAWIKYSEWRAYGLVARELALNKIDFTPQQTVLNEIMDTLMVDNDTI